MHHAPHPAAILALDRKHVPIAVHRHIGVLQELGHLRTANVILHDVVDAARGRLGVAADAPELVGCIIAYRPVRADHAIYGVGLAAEIADPAGQLRQFIQFAPKRPQVIAHLRSAPDRRCDCGVILAAGPSARGGAPDRFGNVADACKRQPARFAYRLDHLRGLR